MTDKKFLVKVGFLEYQATEKQAQELLDGIDTAEETKNLSEHKRELIKLCIKKSIEHKVYLGE